MEKNIFLKQIAAALLVRTNPNESNRRSGVYWPPSWCSLVESCSSLVEGDEGCIGPSDKLQCLRRTINMHVYAAHALQYSMHVWPLGRPSCSSPSTKELHGWIYWQTYTRYYFFLIQNLPSSFSFTNALNLFYRLFFSLPVYTSNNITSFYPMCAAERWNI